MAVRLGFHQIPLLLQVLHNGFPALVAVHPVVGAAVFVNGPIVRDTPDGLQIVAQAHLEVVGVMGGGHLHRAGAKPQLHIFVGHDGNLPVHDGQDAGLAHEVLEPLVLRVDRHAGIAHHGLRPGRRHDEVPGPVGEGVADIPEISRLILVFHFNIRKSGKAIRAPVDDAASLIN